MCKGRTLLLLLSPVAILVLWLVLAEWILPPGWIYKRSESIDVMAGRVRYEKSILSLTVAQRVEETALSRMYRKLVGEPPEPVWEWASADRWDLGHRTQVSSDYLGALHAAQEEWFGEDEARFTGDAQRALATRFLASLQQDEPRAAVRYDSKVSAFAAEWRDAGKGEIDVDDLPAVSSDTGSAE